MARKWAIKWWPVGVSLGVPIGEPFGVSLGVTLGVRRQSASSLASDPSRQVPARDVFRRTPRADFVPSGGPSRKPPPRVRDRAKWLEFRLSERDWAILETVFQLRAVTSGQIQRLHFCEPSQAAYLRKRALRRLTEWRALHATDRRIGGPHGGSRRQIYVLDPAAQLLLESRLGSYSHRRSAVNSAATMRLAMHTLTVAELYTQCVEESRTGTFELLDFQAEPDCWWPLETGGYLKPDAYICVASPGSEFVDHWWVEVDLGTMRTPHMRTKFAAYSNYAATGMTGPGGVLPGVLVTTPNGIRTTALKRIIARMGPSARALINVADFPSAVTVLAAHALNKSEYHEERTTSP